MSKPSDPDERGLERSVNRIDDGVVDVALETRSIEGFDFVSGENSVLDDSYTGFFDMRHVDEHGF